MQTTPKFEHATLPIKGIQAEYFPRDIQQNEDANEITSTVQRSTDIMPKEIIWLVILVNHHKMIPLNLRFIDIATRILQNTSNAYSRENTHKCT
jgi:hypothetical protein